MGIGGGTGSCDIVMMQETLARKRKGGRQVLCGGFRAENVVVGVELYLDGVRQQR